MVSNDHSSASVTGAENVPDLSPRQAAERCSGEAILLDVREEYLSQFKKFDVPVCIQIPLSRLHNECDALSRDKLIIVSDSSGLQSKEAILVLRERRFERLANLAGGFVEWERDGMPIVVNTKERLSGSCACQLRPRERT